MHGKTIKQLLALKEELNSILETRSEKLLESTKSSYLQEELQRNIVDYISETIDQIDMIMDNIEGGEYDENDNEELDDY
jgi:hypothetical protein